MASYVLIIESNEVLRYSIAELFNGEDYSVVAESESRDGVSRVIQNNPGLILMGEEMPDLDGVELLPIIRRMTNSPLIVVGSGDEEAVVKALLQGADMYLRTPINYRELLSRARALLRRSASESDGGSHTQDEVHLIRDFSQNLRAPFQSALRLGIKSVSLDRCARTVLRTLVRFRRPPLKLTSG